MIAPTIGGLLLLVGFGKATQVGQYVNLAKKGISVVRNSWDNIVAEHNERCIRNGINPLYDASEEEDPFFRVQITPFDQYLVRVAAFGESSREASAPPIPDFNGEYILRWSEIELLRQHVRVSARNLILSSDGLPLAPMPLDYPSILLPGAERLKDPGLATKAQKTYGFGSLRYSKAKTRDSPI
jgi:hypothetical protein